MSAAIAIPHGQTPEQVRGTYLKSERAAREAGVVCFVASALFALGVLTMAISLPSRYEILAVVVMTGLMAGVALGYFLIGRALRKLEGWSHTVGFIAALLLLPGIPLGTVMGVFLLLSLSRADRFVFSRTYREVIEATGGQPGKFEVSQSA